MRKAAGVVAMGGYNTFCEILSFDRRAILVPRTEPRREQAIRALAAERLGLVRVLMESDGRSPGAHGRGAARPAGSGRAVAGPGAGPARRARRGRAPGPGAWPGPAPTRPCAAGLLVSGRPDRRGAEGLSAAVRDLHRPGGAGAGAARPAAGDLVAAPADRPRPPSDARADPRPGGLPAGIPAHGARAGAARPRRRPAAAAPARAPRPLRPRPAARSLGVAPAPPRAGPGARPRAAGRGRATSTCISSTPPPASPATPRC